VHPVVTGAYRRGAKFERDGTVAHGLEPPNNEPDTDGEADGERVGCTDVVADAVVARQCEWHDQPGERRHPDLGLRTRCSSRHKKRKANTRSHTVT
jgi:hypothetical protein